MSDKLKVIDYATFEGIQQNSSSCSTMGAPKIRNSKYKRMAATGNFNLMQFAKPKQEHKSVLEKVNRQKRVADQPIVAPKKKGKQREGGKTKKPTPLKKSILQYRQKKLEQTQTEDQQSDSIDQTTNSKMDDRKSKLHSTKFRSYCNCCITPDLKKYCEQLIRDLNYYQRRAYAQNEIKARAHRRFVVGFRQVQSYLPINKIKLVIIATDCEHNEGDVTLNETIDNIKTVCSDQQIPVVFAFQRRKMAYFLYKQASISCIGILDYDGARDVFANLVEALKNAREMYESLVSKN